MKIQVTLINVCVFLLPCTGLLAGPGDTIRIQTIDFETPVNPGWNAPREGRYLFPPDSIDFEKILMYYTLKCDPNQNPACGEWDYTTHTQLWFQTGQYDSNLYSHPNYLLDGMTPDTFKYMNTTSWKYMPVFEYFNQTIPSFSASIGNGNNSMALANGSTEDGRLQFLIRGEELISAGFEAGDLTALQLLLISGGGYFSHFTIRMAQYESDSLLALSLTEGLTEVYNRNVLIDASAYETFDFSQPFFWDGGSNLLIDLSYDGNTGTIPTILAADPVAVPSAVVSLEPDYFLDFEGTDHADVPAEAFEMIDSAVTICFWQYGDPLLQPQDNSIFGAVDSAGNRVLNVHLPWSNSRVYWDAGNDNGYDRIQMTLPNPSYYEGKWNHWAFVKDCRTGEMKIFFNGELFSYAWGKYKSMSGIAAFHIGAHPYGQMHYDGMIDEFQVWDIALDEATVADWMHKSLDSGHPYYDNLVAYYRFDEASGFTAADSGSGSFDALLYGYPAHLDHSGQSRMMNFIPSETRLHFVLQQGVFNPALTDSVLVVDTIPYSPLMAVIYGDSLSPLVSTDTLTVWPSYYNNYIYDPQGNAIDSSFVTPDGELVRHDWEYYGEPFEILEPYELGRFITPYGNGLSLGEGWTWVYDMTDFRPLLCDSVHLTAGNFQELLDLDFLMIEGTPPRDVVKIDKLWNGYFSLSGFSSQVPPLKLPLDSIASGFKVKITTSGHEWDNPTNCAEFCEKTHWLDVDSTTRYTWEILDECADNPLYPQGGTWIYDRAGWCPGARVTEKHLEISGYVAGDSVLLDYNCESDPYGAYSVSSYLFSYGAPNFLLDAAVGDIIAPSTWKTFLRFNPICGRPVIVIRNTGATPLTSLVITFGPQGGIMQNHNWTGSLEFMQTEKVTLDPIDWTGWINGNNYFTVTLSSPNGGEDEYEYNNTLTSPFTLCPEYPNEFIIKFKTNKAGYENRWEIIREDGSIVLEKDGFENQTIYLDTVLLADGCYTFTLYDEGDDGISFWANNMGSGYLMFLDMEGGLLQSFNGDFGKYTSRSFTVGMAVNMQDLVKEDYFRIYPNPCRGELQLEIALPVPKNVQVIITAADGRTVFREDYGIIGTSRLSVQLDAAPGIYVCHLRCRENSLSQKFILLPGP